MKSQLPPGLANLTESALREYAAIVFGSDEDGTCWFDTPAIALNRMRPADFMGTEAGRELVRTLLGRIDYGVYN